MNETDIDAALRKMYAEKIDEIARILGDVTESCIDPRRAQVLASNAVNEALMRLVQEHLFKLLMAEEGEFDLPKVARAVAELGRATVTQKKWQAEVRARAEAAAAAVEKIAKKGGLSAESVDQLRREILGIAA